MLASPVPQTDAGFSNDLQSTLSGPEVQVMEFFNPNLFHRTVMSKYEGWILGYNEGHEYKVFLSEIPDWLDLFVTKIEPLIQLQPNWDSYGAKAIEFQSVLNAIKLFLSIESLSNCFPAIVPTVNGGLQAEWHDSDVDIEVDIDPNGRIHYIAERTGQDVQEFVGSVDSDRVSLAREIDAALGLIAA